MAILDANDWYIKVNDKSPTTKRWSTNRRQYITISGDAAYSTWLSTWGASMVEEYATEAQMLKEFGNIAWRLSIPDIRPAILRIAQSSSGTYQLTNPLPKSIIVHDAAGVNTDLILPPMNHPLCFPPGERLFIQKTSGSGGVGIKTYGSVTTLLDRAAGDGLQVNQFVILLLQEINVFSEGIWTNSGRLLPAGTGGVGDGIGGGGDGGGA